MQRPERIDAVIFDFDGVVSDTELPKCRYVQRQLADRGVCLSDDEALSLCGGDDAETVPVLLARHGSSMTIEEYFAAIPDIDSVYSSGTIVPSPGLVDLIRSLRGRGVKTAIASSTTTACLLAANELMGIADLFDAVVGGDMVGRIKPAPDVYERALALTGIAAEHAVAVEDSPFGIEAAQTAGIYTFGYRGNPVKLDVSAANELIDSFVGFEL